MVLDWETKRVLGVSMVGRDAGGTRVPTMAEALKIAALSFFKDVERLSCCAE